MVTTAYNASLREVQEQFIAALQAKPTFFDKLGKINLTSVGGDVRECQMGLLEATFGTSIGDEYEFEGKGEEWEPFKHVNKLIQTPMEFKKRAFEGKEIVANLSNLIAQKVNQHALVRDEFLFLGDTRIAQFNALGVKVSTANSTINKPASCESTPGTTETITATPFGGNRTTMAAQVLDSTVRKLFLGKINTEAGTRLVTNDLKITAFVHPIMLGYLDTAMYDGSAYMSVTNKQYLEGRGWTLISTELADSDYAGADDGSTQIHCFSNMNELFKASVFKQGAWDGPDFWEDDKKMVYRNRFSEIVGGFAMPFKHSDTYFYKGYLEVTCKGYDSTA